MNSDPQLHWRTQFLMRMIAAIAAGAAAVLLLNYTADAVAAAQPAETTVSAQLPPPTD